MGTSLVARPCCYDVALSFALAWLCLEDTERTIHGVSMELFEATLRQSDRLCNFLLSPVQESQRPWSASLGGTAEMKSEAGTSQFALLDGHLTAIGLQYVSGDGETYALPRF